MFDAEDEDVTNKVPAVSPNDVIDIEISSVIRAQGSSWLKGFDKTQGTQKAQALLSTSKERKTKKLKHSHSSSKKQRGIMKRGDPFLPSVTCDENPVEDFSSKKATHKKPLDCKCKGMGFNSSPSAVLPEEMRQQWGCGVFGKTTPTGTSSADNAELANTTRSAIANCHPVDTMTNKVFSDRFICGGSTMETRDSPGLVPGGFTPFHGCECKKASCSCPNPKIKQESFLPFSEATERKRPKMTSKSSGYKIKGNKTQILISGKHNLQTMKTIACINSKENTNIISTSNFNKYNHGPSSFSTFRHEHDSESPSYKGGIGVGNISRHSTAQGNTIDCTYSGRAKMYSSPPRMMSDETDVTSSRYRHPLKTTRHSYAQLLSTRDNSAVRLNGTVRFYETRNCMPRVTPQIYTPSSQSCSCDRCRRKAQLLSKMEALGFPSSSAQMSPSPFSYPVSQRYFATGGLQSSFHSSNQYPPCAPLPHTYASNPGLYCPPSSYDRTSPISFEQDSYSNNSDVLSSSPMPLTTRGVNTDTSSYLDNEQSLESPLSYSGIVEDITDLSIKDTVEFFMTLKSPLEESQTSTLSLSDDTASEMLPGLSSEDEAFNCCTGTCACSTNDAHHLFRRSTNSDAVTVDTLTPTPPHELDVHNYADSCPSDAPTQSMSMLYSSLMSNLGLEDELRSAIENIPTE